MRKCISLFLIITLCFINTVNTFASDDSASTWLDEQNITTTDLEVYSGLNDPELLRFMEDAIYADLVQRLDSDEYFVENVEAIYISKEYLEELEYNSKENIFFGYTLSELEAAFEGTKYIFTQSEDGFTEVREFEEFDDTYEKAIKNVAIGTGIILVCVTVSVITGGLGAPAVSMVFAASAKTGAIMAVSSGVISGAASVIVTGFETKDFDEALKAGVRDGSSAFKWGALTGALTGGTIEAAGLYGASLNGLTMNEAALIQKESGYPLDVIKQFKSMEEYNVYKNAGLTPHMIDGKLALIRDIDLDYKSVQADGSTITNLELMAEGKAPIDPATGKYYQLHHINQNPDGTLAILTGTEHQGNAGILNIPGKASEIDRKAFEKIREEFWKSFAKQMGGM